MRKNTKSLIYDFPKKIYRGKECIDWKASIGSEIKFIYNDIEGYIKIIDYNLETHKLKVIYNDNICDIYAGDFLRCQFGNKLLKKKTCEFKADIGTNFKDNKRDLIITDRKYIKSKSNGQMMKFYKYKCNICGYDCGKYYSQDKNEYINEHWILESSLLRGSNCICCSSRFVVEGINNIPTTDPWMIKYFQGGYDEAKLYNKSSCKKIYPICPDCKKVKDKPMSINEIYRKKSIGCNCSNNIGQYPKNFMINLLNQLSIKYISEKYFDWCVYYNPYKQKKTFGIYDFYISSMNLIIEMDGGLGHGKRIHSKDNKTLDESKYIDNIKDELAEKHGIKVIRIDCDYKNVEHRFNYIKENAINELKDIFDLSNIDWIKIGQDSEKNIVKEICEYWHLHNEINNENISVKNIADIFNKKESYIYGTLAKGSYIGWCIYNNNNKNNSNILIKLKKGYPICENKQFKSIKECAEYYNINYRTMCHWLNHDCKMPKNFYDMGLHYSNETMEDYEYYEVQEKKKKIHNENRQSKYRKVICITTGKIFNKIVDGARYYNCNSDSITECCKGRKKSCGKLEDETKLQWKYINDLTKEEYIKYDIENKLKEWE